MFDVGTLALLLTLTAYAVMSIPFVLLWQVNKLPLRKRISLAGLFSLVCVTMAIAFVRASQITAYKGQPDNSRTTLWSFVEQSIGELGPSRSLSYHLLICRSYYHRLPRLCPCAVHVRVEPSLQEIVPTSSAAALPPAVTRSVKWQEAEASQRRHRRHCECRDKLRRIVAAFGSRIRERIHHCELKALRDMHVWQLLEAVGIPYFFDPLGIPLVSPIRHLLKFWSTGG